MRKGTDNIRTEKGFTVVIERIIGGTLKQRKPTVEYDTDNKRPKAKNGSRSNDGVTE